jgi:hypothetical protein
METNQCSFVLVGGKRKGQICGKVTGKRVNPLCSRHRRMRERDGGISDRDLVAGNLKVLPPDGPATTISINIPTVNPSPTAEVDSPVLADSPSSPAEVIKMKVGLTPITVDVVPATTPIIKARPASPVPEKGVEVFYLEDIDDGQPTKAVPTAKPSPSGPTAKADGPTTKADGPTAKADGPAPPVVTFNEVEGDQREEEYEGEEYEGEEEEGLTPTTVMTPENAQILARNIARCYTSFPTLHETLPYESICELPLMQQREMIMADIIKSNQEVLVYAGFTALTDLSEYVAIRNEIDMTGLSVALDPYANTKVKAALDLWILENCVELDSSKYFNPTTNLMMVCASTGFGIYMANQAKANKESLPTVPSVVETRPPMESGEPEVQVQGPSFTQ